MARQKLPKGAQTDAHAEIDALAIKPSPQALAKAVADVRKEEVCRGFMIRHSKAEMLGEIVQRRSEQDHLVLYAPEKNKAIVLGYSMDVEGDDPKITVDLVQKSPIANISEAKRTIPGDHPYEFLIKRFLSRIKPILEMRPDTEVAIAKDQDTRAERRTYKPIRDRFFGKDWRLGLNRKRVKQALGDELVSRMNAARA